MADKYSLTDDAKNDIKNIWSFIAKDNRRAADKVIEEIKVLLQHIGENSHFGHRRVDLTSKDVRFVSVYSYLIVYNPNHSPVEIVRVLSGYRNITNMI